MIKYEEGQVFAVPLRTNGFGLILIARKAPQEKIILGYLFTCRFDAKPSIDEIKQLTAQDAFKVLRFGDLSIVNGEWLLIGKIPGWNKQDWPFPSFVRQDELSKTARKIIYNDGDPTKIKQEDKIQYPSDLERDAMHGAGVIEILLTKMLSK